MQVFSLTYATVSITQMPLFTDANTIGMIAGLASIDWGCAVQVMAAATIASNGTFEPTSAQILCAILSLLHLNCIDVIPGLALKSAVYVAIVLSHAALCSLGTTVLARLQTVYTVLNVL
jgi:hypothetical protein